MSPTKSVIRILAALVLSAAPSSVVYAGPLPPLINFQSVLLDEGGNLLPSGPATVQFQILDETHEPIYFEKQTVDVVKGAVSALVGNGSNDQGITTGGIPEDIFATGAPRYLQVQVGVQAPEEPMTIVSVPYAQWSQVSATVADGAVSSAKIATAAVGFEHLAPDVVGKLAAELSASHGILTTQSLASIGGATQVGVTAKFINSGSSSVQGVLQDIDLSVKKGQEQDQFLLGKLNKELDKTQPGSLAQQISSLQDTTKDINNIPGKLKLDHLEPNSAAVSDLNMGGHKITNLQNPINAADATSKFYVDDGLVKVASLFIKKDGTTGDISADIPFNKHKITELAEPTALQDASTKNFVESTVAGEAGIRKTADDAINGILADINNIPGQLSLSKVNTANSAPSNLNMGNNKIINLSSPSNGADAATKDYVDAAVTKSAAESAPLSSTTRIKSGTYKGCTSAPCQDVTIDAGFKPKAIQIIKDPDAGDYREYFGNIVNDKIKGWLKGGTTLEKADLPVNGTVITIPMGNLNPINAGTFYYTIWGTDQ